MELMEEEEKKQAVINKEVEMVCKFIRLNLMLKFVIRLLRD